jgi:hypothetical protein
MQYFADNYLDISFLYFKFVYRLIAPNEKHTAYLLLVVYNTLIKSLSCNFY